MIGRNRPALLQSNDNHISGPCPCRRGRNVRLRKSRRFPKSVLQRSNPSGNFLSMTSFLHVSSAPMSLSTKLAKGTLTCSTFLLQNHFRPSPVKQKFLRPCRGQNGRLFCLNSFRFYLFHQ